MSIWSGRRDSAVNRCDTHVNPKFNYAQPILMLYMVEALGFFLLVTMAFVRHSTATKNGLHQNNKICTHIALCQTSPAIVVLGKFIKIKSASYAMPRGPDHIIDV